jgi:hypothetical protein
VSVSSGNSAGDMVSRSCPLQVNTHAFAYNFPGSHKTTLGAVVSFDLLLGIVIAGDVYARVDHLERLHGHCGCCVSKDERSRARKLRVPLLTPGGSLGTVPDQRPELSVDP